MSIAKHHTKLRLKDIHIKVLIVDDERLVLTGLARILKEKYEVLTASSGIEALELFKAHTPQIILTDHMMPEMTGLELCEQIGQCDSHTIRIVMTAHKEIDAIFKAMDSGLIYYYVYKPINIETLKNVIHRGALEYVADVNHQRYIKTIKDQNNRLIKQNEMLEQNNQFKFQFLEEMGALLTPLSQQLLTEAAALASTDPAGIPAYFNQLTLSQTLDNFLTQGQIQAGNYAFTTVDTRPEQIQSAVQARFAPLLADQHLQLTWDFSGFTTSAPLPLPAVIQFIENGIFLAVCESCASIAVQVSVSVTDTESVLLIDYQGEVTSIQNQLTRDSISLTQGYLTCRTLSYLAKGMASEWVVYSPSADHVQIALQFPAA